MGAAGRTSSASFLAAGTSAAAVSKRCRINAVMDHAIRSLVSPWGKFIYQVLRQPHSEPRPPTMPAAGRRGSPVVIMYRIHRTPEQAAGNPVNAALNPWICSRPDEAVPRAGR